jgi:two-component system LytT family response regulator
MEKCIAMKVTGTAGVLTPVAQNKFQHEPVLTVSHPETRPYGVNSFMFVKSEHNVIKVSFHEIYYIEGYKDYVKIFTGGPRPILTILTFRSLEEILPPDLFVRIHKSFIISIEKIKSFRRGKVLVQDKHIPIGASYQENFNQKVVAGRLISDF